MKIDGITKFIEFKNSVYKIDWDHQEARFSLYLYDMKSQETWNLKQQFLYIEVEWPEKTIITKQIVWDKIIPRSKIRNNYSLKETFEYPITDIYKSLKGRDVTFRVWTELMPIFGIITRVNF